MMETALIGIGMGSLAAWLYLALGRGGFWLAPPRLEVEELSRLAGRAPGSMDAADELWPAVAAVVPARDDGGLLAESLGSLLGQDYPGELEVVVVDDGSDGATAQIARQVAGGRPLGPRLTVISTAARHDGPGGRMSGVAAGASLARERMPDSRYLWVTDADVVHHPRNLTRLVAEAEAGRHALVAQLVPSDAGRGWPGLLLPAAAYFFQLLHPFARLNEDGAGAAGAPSGSLLLRATALEAIGGAPALGGDLRDEGALARRVRDTGGRLHLAVTESARSVRSYRGLASVWRRMAGRAFGWLRCSPLRLGVAVSGLGLVFLVPPVLALAEPLHHSTPAALLGLGAWAIAALTFLPTLRLYRRPLALAAALPVAALAYLGISLDSALRYASGRSAPARGKPWSGRLAAGTAAARRVAAG